MWLFVSAGPGTLVSIRLSAANIPTIRATIRAGRYPIRIVVTREGFSGNTICKLRGRGDINRSSVAAGRIIERSREMRHLECLLLGRRRRSTSGERLGNWLRSKNRDMHIYYL